MPGATVTFRDGHPVGIDAVEAIEKIADTIEKRDLPLVLHIIGQTALARAVELKALESRVVVTREASPDLVLGALKLTMEVWRRYPDVDLRSELNQDMESSLIPA